MKFGQGTKLDVERIRGTTYKIMGATGPWARTDPLQKGTIGEAAATTIKSEELKADSAKWPKEFRTHSERREESNADLHKLLARF
jgi:hypothetical protein